MAAEGRRRLVSRSLGGAPAACPQARVTCPPPRGHSSLPTPSGPQAASAGWEGGAPEADKIWKREVCVELGAVCSLEQVNVPTSCPSRPWESTSKQPDLQKEGQAWPEVGGLGEEREGRKRGAASAHSHQAASSPPPT